MFKDFFNRQFNIYDSETEFWKFLAGNIAAGGFAGQACTLFVYPLDFARTRLGVDVGRQGRTQFKSLRHVFLSIYKSDGISGLYNGMATSMFSIFLYRGMYFGFFDTGKKMIKDYNQLSIVYKFMFAQFVTTSVETLQYPLDTIRRQLMMNSGLKEKLYTGPFDALAKLY